jgi:hypothetical protein
MTHAERERGILAIHTKQDHSELFAFKFFAAIAKGCASLPDCEALLMQLYARQDFETLAFTAVFFLSPSPSSLSPRGPGAPLSLLCQLTNTGHLNFFLAPLIPGDD